MGRLEPALGTADEIVAVEGDAAPHLGIANDVGAQEHHQVGLAGGAALVAKQHAHPRQAGKKRNAVVGLGVAVLQQAAEHHDLAVVEQDAGVDGALVGDRAGGTGGAFVDAADLLVDVELDRAAFGDLRAHVELEPHLFALDGLERVVAGAAAIGDVLAADKGDGLADEDARRLVVQGQQVGRGQHVAAALAGQGAGQHLEVEHLADAGDVHRAVHHAHAQAGGQRVDAVPGTAIEPGTAQVGAAEHAVLAQVAGLPLDAEFVGV
uniref:PE-PGRS family protein n=1 Tax=Steinernema glaseri TaxID=37863 RepID=A0A1I8ADY8_9BILA